jgi:hypothetical protein
MFRGNWCYRVISVGSRPPSLLSAASAATTASSATSASSATTASITAMGVAVAIHDVGDGGLSVVVGTWVAAVGAGVVGVVAPSVGVAVERIRFNWWDGCSLSGLSCEEGLAGD